MPKYVIEREVPGAGRMDDDEVRALSEKSNAALAEIGGDVQWQQSYVTDDKLFCIYIAPDRGRIVAHANSGGFPADAIHEVRRVIDPTTGGR